MLDRYRKSGGFIQLLNLLETCGQQKQEKFMQMIREEDARWAEALEKKMISIKKVFSWREEALAEIAGQLNDLTLAVALHGLEQGDRDKLMRTFSHLQKHKIEDLSKSKQPTPGEISTIMAKLLTEVRRMITDGKLRMDKVDPELVIDDDIEELLERQANAAEAEAVEAAIEINMPELAHTGTDANASPATREEILALKKKVATLGQENSVLKVEVTKLKNKIDQIKKLAA